MEYEIIRLETVDSTSEDIKRRIKAGKVGAWPVVCSRVETSSTARWGRAWRAPMGGLWFAIGMGPLPRGADATRIGVLANISAAESIEALTGAPAGISWPNDIMLQGCKVGATVSERFWSGGATFTAVRFGINVLNPMNSPDQTSARSLKELGYEIEPDALLDAILNGFGARYKNNSPQAWEDALTSMAERSAITQGTLIEARMIDQEVNGAFAGFDHDGYLLLCKPDGSVTPVIPEELVRIHFHRKQQAP